MLQVLYSPSQHAYTCTVVGCVCVRLFVSALVCTAIGFPSTQQKLETIQVSSLNHSTQPEKETKGKQEKGKDESARKKVNRSLTALFRDRFSIQNPAVFHFFKTHVRCGFAVFLHQRTSGMTGLVDLWQLSSV